MAPTEADLYNSNVLPVSIFGGYLVVCSALTVLVSYDVLYKASQALPPSQDTRHRQPNREKHMRLFAMLTLVSLATTWYHKLQYLNLSYRVWAYEVGQPVPTALWGENRHIALGTFRLALGRWLQDTSLFRDAWEIVLERSGRYWWSQQIFLGAAAWSVYVGIEGRQRNIPHLWAFLVLGHTVAISFAMNLFFLAVLLTPVPLPLRNEEQLEDERSHQGSTARTSARRGKTTPKARTALNGVVSTFKTFLPPLITQPQLKQWYSHPAAMIIALIALHACVFLLPFSVATPQFWSVLSVAHLVLFQPVYIDRLAPVAYGSTIRPRRNYLVVYRFLSYASLLLYLKQTFVALLDNDPGAYKHRHSHYLASMHLPHENRRGPMLRTASSISRVLGSLSDHPAVASMGWDVLMCAISLATWATIRGLDTSCIAAASTGLITPTASHAQFHPSSLDFTHIRSMSVTSNASANVSPGPRVRKRRNNGQGQGKAGEKDGEFSPNEAVADSVRGEEEMDENLEAAAVSWALFTLGGLGVLAPGVLGADSETNSSVA